MAPKMPPLAAPGSNAAQQLQKGQDAGPVNPPTGLKAEVETKPAKETIWQKIGAARPRPAAPGISPLNGADPTLKGQQISDEIRMLLSKESLSPGDAVNINQRLKGATGPEVDYVLSHAPVADLLGKLGALSPDWRGDAIKNLSSRTDLSLDSKANLLVSLERTGQTSDVELSQNQNAIRDLLTSTRGSDLVALKDGIDATGDQSGMLQLVFDSVEDPRVRGQILDHFQKEAQLWKAPGAPPLPVKVLSDVDDTFKQGWTDKSVPKGAEYPGVKEFYKALESGAKNTQTRPTDLAFLTARPPEMEELTSSMLAKHGVTGEVLLENSPLHFIGNENIAKGKDDNYDKYRQLYPERKMVFLGDSGQGDPLTGGHMITGPNYNGSVYIHDVCEDDGPKTSAADRADKAKQGLVYSDTYAGAALAAFQKGDINLDQLVRVAQATIDGTKTVPFNDDAQRSRFQGWVNRDVGLINQALKAAGDPRQLKP